MSTAYPPYAGRQPASSIAPYRPTGYAPQPSRPNVIDDYERWYTDSSPSNRMLLALRSGIDQEVGWALDRLCRLCHNEQFLLSAIPGITEALFVWPDWYVNGGYYQLNRAAPLFALPPAQERLRRHVMESIFILRNAAVNPANANDLAGSERARTVILLALHRLQPDSDTNTEFLLHIVELMEAISTSLTLPPPDSPLLANPLPPIQDIAGRSTNRSLIIAAFSTLNLLLSNPSNVGHLRPDTPALAAAIRYLPLFADKQLQSVSLDYLYTHLSHPPMSKAFLLHPELSATLRLLVMVLLSNQQEETVAVEIGGPVHTVPAQAIHTKEHEVTKEELETLVSMPEPQRCYEWMRTMFVASPEGEMTQVDFWNLYKDVFLPYQDRFHLLVASDVIKNVNVVFPQAQAMVLPGPPQKFIVRGVCRRKDKSAQESFHCLWDHSQCTQGPFSSPGDLYEHVLEAHINPHEGKEISCSWATCLHPPLSKSHIRGHILTHLPSTQPPPQHPAQAGTVTLPYEGFPHPVPDPTTRPPPPARSTTITYRRPVVDPPSSALTALLCIRILFRSAFASSDAAPRVDEDHFGFPGIVEDMEDDGESQTSGDASEKEGERRGKKAFIGVRHLMERVRIRDETLMGWITEMVDAGTTDPTTLLESSRL